MAKRSKTKNAKRFSAVKIVICIGMILLYFIPAIATISDYNVNWDAPIHYTRGQAYLHYFLTGKTHYTDLRGFKSFEYCLSEKRACSSYPYSIYQSSQLDGAYFMQYDEGHPPLNGTLAALFNLILYQKLRLFGDIEAYHFFILSTSFIALALVSYWSYKEFGLLAGVVTYFSLFLLPLFINESHNNIKDPVEMTFFSFAIYSLYRAANGKFVKWGIISAICSGLALGTKFNIAFLPFIMILWVFLLCCFSLWKKILKHVQIPKIILGAILYAVIVLSIFFISWPFLWKDPIHNTLSIVKYYIEIGTGSTNQPQFLLDGFNTYPILFIIYTTPLPILFLITLGIAGVIFNIHSSRKQSALLWLVWFLFPIARVTIPGSSIYGGVRQIMEYAPALALLCGIGAITLKEFLNIFLKDNTKTVVITTGCLGVSFIFIIHSLLRIHPNEPFYFNELIGGLGGASKKFPIWDTALGNQYMQGVEWVNRRAEKNAVMVLSFGTMTNIPLTKVRRDITYANDQESLIFRKGEYILGLTNINVPLFYDGQYPNRYLIPVYQVTVDDVPILNIWKNDVAHTKKGFINEEDVSSRAKITLDFEGITATLDKAVYVTRLEIATSKSCPKPLGGRISTSLDNLAWKDEVEELLTGQIPQIQKLNKGVITQLLAAVPAKYIKILISHEQTCPINDYTMKIIGLQDVRP